MTAFFCCSKAICVCRAFVCACIARVCGEDGWVRGHKLGPQNLCVRRIGQGDQMTYPGSPLAEKRPTREQRKRNWQGGGVLPGCRGPAPYRRQRGHNAD
jgi:hypothetical protein